MRGALVYINDLEGKITKINLSSKHQGFEDGKLVADQTELYDQTTLFRLDANEANARYSYFSMDAGLGVSDGGFWLFGSTGNFIDLGNRSDDIDNILYGIQDKHYPYWKHLNGVTIPKPVSTSSTVTTSTAGTGGEGIQINPEFIKKAHAGANDASSIDNRGATDSCLKVTGNYRRCKLSYYPCRSPGRYTLKKIVVEVLSLLEHTEKHQHLQLCLKVR